MWKEMVATYFNVLSHNLPQGTEENDKRHQVLLNMKQAFLPVDNDVR